MYRIFLPMYFLIEKIESVPNLSSYSKEKCQTSLTLCDFPKRKTHEVFLH